MSRSSTEVSRFSSISNGGVFEAESFSTDAARSSTIPVGMRSLGASRRVTSPVTEMQSSRANLADASRSSGSTTWVTP